MDAPGFGGNVRRASALSSKEAWASGRTENLYKQAGLRSSPEAVSGVDGSVALPGGDERGVEVKDFGAFVVASDGAGIRELSAVTLKRAVIGELDVIRRTAQGRYVGDGSDVREGQLAVECLTKIVKIAVPERAEIGVEVTAGLTAEILRWGAGVSLHTKED